MFEADQICPYTGLRSFTEEESLYFKGREEDIDQATIQLQRNKFLMLTGASGDGKSSLIYAGIIPNARAGFLKSKYSQWCVADFRPERTPFHNLCKSISRQLAIGNPYTVQAELNHGFSAIIDLYRNSKRYIDTSSVGWQMADAGGKAALKREAANLIILVDQFEEFFTNPENYHKGVPSTDAGLVLNLLLETARIALEEDLPVYVVFTMRSDYIGQCASFRGLPEYIGFSQFFVPRLNRTQLQQVIEEPSALSGNRISRRLTERLIHDLTEGVDQLPILQHALNQVWHAADNGREEMDLIHYAMVGGMPVNELPDEQVERFKKWYEDLSPEIKACYHEPNLQNVLDTHTNKLFEQAAEYFSQKTLKNISDEDAKDIIKKSFICLTKIDQSRAVRNRMTLKEITNIIGRPGFGTKEVGAVLNIFREPGNTFIHPFISDDPDSKFLNENDILDITHESLIRNWAYLRRWAREEFDNNTISLDFKQQLKRWVESGKSNNFLLSIGQLTYFENWFKTAKPNVYWIARYLPEDRDQDNKLSKAKQVLDNSREFLSRSEGRHVITRTLMRYGTKRIAAVLALIVVLMLSSFVVRDYFQKQNDYVLKSIKTKSIELANKLKLSVEFPVPLINEQLMLGHITIPEVINAITDTMQKIRIATGIATQIVVQGRNEPKKEIMQSLGIVDSLLNSVNISILNPRQLSEALKLINDYRATAEMAWFFSQDKTIHSWIKKNAQRSANSVLLILQQQPDLFDDIQNLTLSLENGINHRMFTEEQTDQILKMISPFENTKAPSSAWLKKNFDRDQLLTRGTLGYGFKFNGLFQQLAYLYASKGNSEKVLQCIDSLLLHNQNYYQNDYGAMADNATNIAAVFYTYDKKEALGNFVNGYSQKIKITPRDFYSRAAGRTLITNSTTSDISFYSGGGGQDFSNLNLKFSADALVTYFYEKLRSELLKVNDEDDRNFSLAIAYKNEGLMHCYRQEMRGLTKADTLDNNFKKACEHYRQVSDEFLNRSLPLIGTSGVDIISMPHRFLFIFPDFRVPFHPVEPRSFYYFHSSHSFVDYVSNNGLFDTLYANNSDLKYFELWLSDYHVHMSSRDWMMRDPMPYEFLQKLTLKMEQRKANELVDLNILYLHLGTTAFERGDNDNGVMYIRKVQPDKLLNAFAYKSFNFVNTYSLELVAISVAHMTASGKFSEVYPLINVFRKQVNRSSIYGYASQYLALKHRPSDYSRQLLDSARSEMLRIENPAVFQPNRLQVAMALMYDDAEKNSDEAYRTIKNASDKIVAITEFSKAHAFNGNLYKAQQQTPSFISSSGNAFFLGSILDGLNESQTEKREWKKFKSNVLIFARRYLPYINENE